MRRFAYAVLAADELVAATSTVKFRYDDGTTFLSWTVGEKVDGAVWIALFLVLATIVNMFPVRVCFFPFFCGCRPPRVVVLLLLTQRASTLENLSMSLAASKWPSLQWLSC